MERRVLKCYLIFMGILIMLAGIVGLFKDSYDGQKTNAVLAFNPKRITGCDMIAEEKYERNSVQAKWTEPLLGVFGKMMI